MDMALPPSRRALLEPTCWSSILTLGDLFSIKRGMATGANSFFILARSEAIRMGIPADSLHPILPSSSACPTR